MYTALLESFPFLCTNISILRHYCLCPTLQRPVPNFSLYHSSFLCYHGLCFFAQHPAGPTAMGTPSIALHRPKELSHNRFSFLSLPHCPFCKPFVLITMHLMGGWGGAQLRCYGK